MDLSVLASIRSLLDSAGVEYRQVSHEQTYTSEQSARARGEEIRIGGKAMVIKFDEAFRLFVLSAERRIDSGAIRARFGIRKLRFASKEELTELTGLVSGSVPPFGKPILPFDLYVDGSILENEKIAFNAGSLTDSVIMRVPDYIEIAKPDIFDFSSDA